MNPMSRKNVFLYDIDVPEIVQEKAETAFSMIRTEGDKNMVKKEKEQKNKRKNKNKQIIIISSAMAACAAATALVIGLKGIWDRRPVTDIVSDTGAEGIPVDTEKEEEDLLSAIDNMFTLQVKAAELEEGQPVALVDRAPEPGNDSQITGEQASSWVLDGTEDGDLAYCIQFPLSCVGNNIEKITYRINNGAFQVVQPKGESIIVDGQPYNGELNTGQIGGGWDEESGLPRRDWEVLLYQSFTVDYAKQSGEDTWINICNALPGKQEEQQLIWGDGNSLEEKNRGMQGMFENTVITCTVCYQDGTSQTASVLINSRIMTCAEAGAEVKEDPDREEIFITFELQ